MMPGCRPGFCLCMSFNWIHECMGSCMYVCVIKLMNMFYLAQCRDQSYGFTIHLYGIFACFALDIASLHDWRDSQQCRCWCQFESMF